MLNSAHGQPYVLFEGTILDTALLNRMVGDFAGPVKVMVTNPVYSQDRQHVLIPAGTFLLGDVQKVSATGERRLAVRFHRMLMPDGYSVDLDQFHGLDQAGGHRPLRPGEQPLPADIRRLDCARRHLRRGRGDHVWQRLQHQRPGHV